MPVNDDLKAACEWRKQNAKGGRLEVSGAFSYTEDIVDELLAKYAVFIRKEAERRQSSIRPWPELSI
jgi:hypothetical protein